MKLEKQISGRISLKIDENSDIKETLEYAKDNKILAIIISIDNVELTSFREFSFIEELEIKNVKINFKGLNQFTNLKKLIIQDTSKTEIDLSALINLEDLSITHRKKTLNLEKLINLRRLNFFNFALSDFVVTKEMDKLENVAITRSRSLKSLNGLDTNSLRRFYLYSCPYLDDLSVLANSKKLRYLELHSCKGIKKLDFLGNCDELVYIDLMDCGDIESLKPLLKLKKLKYINFYGTTLKDGDLSGFKDKALNFINKKHYSHKKKDFLSGNDVRHFI